QTLTPTSTWFEPYERPRGPSRTGPPSAHVKGFWLDSLGRAWVVGEAPDPHWASAEGELQKGEGGFEYFQPKSENAVRDGIIDLIDLRDGHSIVTYRRDAGFGRIADPGVMYDWRVTGDGWTQVDLYRVSLRTAH